MSDLNSFALVIGGAGAIVSVAAAIFAARQAKRVSDSREHEYRSELSAKESELSEALEQVYALEARSSELLGEHRDLATEREELTAELNRLYQESKVSRIVRHELRSSMLNLRHDLANYTIQAEIDPRKAAREVRELIEEADQMLELLKVTPPSWTQESGKQRIDLVEMILESSKIFKKRFHLDLPDQAMVSAPEAVLRAAIRNVMENAERHTSNAGPITVRVRDTDAEWVVEVSNPTESKSVDLQRVFEPGYRSSSSPRGKGIGLFVTRSALQAVNGSVSVELNDIGSFVATLRILKQGNSERITRV